MASTSVDRRLYGRVGPLGEHSDLAKPRILLRVMKGGSAFMLKRAVVSDTSERSHPLTQATVLLTMYQEHSSLEFAGG